VPQNGSGQTEGAISLGSECSVIWPGISGEYSRIQAVCLIAIRVAVSAYTFESICGACMLRYRFVQRGWGTPGITSLLEKEGCPLGQLSFGVYKLCGVVPGWRVGISIIDRIPGLAFFSGSGPLKAAGVRGVYDGGARCRLACYWKHGMLSDTTQGFPLVFMGQSHFC
jgi:hypothetical protein